MLHHQNLYVHMHEIILLILDKGNFLWEPALCTLGSFQERHRHVRVQAAGIRFVGFRNEQAAGYAAAACGFLTGVPGVLLTVSGPGAVHGIAGLSHAQINTWPMLMLSGSSEQVGMTLTTPSYQG